MKESKIEKPEKEEEIKGKEEKISIAEKEPKPPLLVIYRDNNLFKEWIPILIESLKSREHKIEIQNFPAGTSGEEIRKWWRENKDDLKGKKIIADRTTQGAFSPPLGVEEEFGSEYREKLLKEEKEVMENLDFVGSRALDKWSHAAEKSILKEILGNKELNEIEKRGLDYDDMEVVDKAFPALIKSILESKENIPEEIYVLKSQLSVHEPLRTFSERPKGVSEDEEYHDGIALEKVTGWLTKGGVPLKKLVAIESKMDVENCKKIDRKNNWLIGDRHAVAEASSFEKGTIPAKDRFGGYSIRSATVLRLPFSSFLIDAKK
jgi:hypothetical protein